MDMEEIYHGGRGICGIDVFWVQMEKRPITTITPSITQMDGVMVVTDDDRGWRNEVYSKDWVMNNGMSDLILK